MPYIKIDRNLYLYRSILINMVPVHADILLQGSSGEAISLSIPVNRNFHMLAINELLQAQLGLPVVAQQEIKMGDGRVQVCAIAGPVVLHCLGRQTSCHLLVLPGDTAPYLGSAPLLDLGLTLDAAGKQLIVDHLPEQPGKIYL